METVDTRIEETKPEDDEIQFMDLQKNAGPGPNDVVDQASHRRAESLYKAQHKDTLPKEW